METPPPSSVFDELSVVSGESEGYRLTRSSDGTREVAQTLATIIGPRAQIIDSYLTALSYAPANHLRLLRYRKTRIVFAPTVDEALLGDWAAARRGRELTPWEARQVRRDYGPESGVVGVFDGSINALVFPTAYRCRDLLPVVIHELGHALTVARAQIRASLLDDLPRRVRNHVFSDYYASEDAAETLRNRVHEALAEGYVELIHGRQESLPPALLSELLFMLQSVEDGDHVRFEFENTPDGPRTSSRVSRHEIIDCTDPDEGHLYASVRMTRDAAAWDLVDDELAAQRKKRRRAA